MAQFVADERLLFLAAFLKKKILYSEG